MGPGDLRDGRNVAYFERGVGRRFEPDEFRVGGDGVENIFRIRGINVVHFHAEFFVDVGEEPEGAAVDIVDGHDLIAGLE